MSYSRSKLSEEIITRIKKGETKNIARQIAAYLIENNKTQDLNSLTRDITQLRKSEQEIVELTALSAHKLDDAQIDLIKKTVTKISPNAKDIIINQRIDETVTGGVRLEFANHLLDLSVSAKLNKLKQLTA